MLTAGFNTGLTLPFPSPPAGPAEAGEVITEEAGIRPSPGPGPRVTPLVEEGALVACGAAVACLRDAPDIRLVAPMAGRVGRIALLPGRRLSEIVIFRESAGDAAAHDTAAAGSAEGVRRLMQAAGVWPWLRRRPFGGMPPPAEVPAAIVVMAADTRPHAPDPRAALAGREDDFARGLAALGLLTEGPVFLCQAAGPPLAGRVIAGGKVRVVTCGPRHPQGLAGIRIHGLCPAGIDAPVWDLHAEDVAALGGLLETGILPQTRLVRVAGPALREGRLLRTRAGADLRALTRRHVAPGAHEVWSGSALDGHPAQWLGPRDRQVTALDRPGPAPRPHWLVSALTRSARPRPVIPTPALTQAFGGTLPAAAFLRALSAGDDETAMKLGALSLLEEDVALADYVLGGGAGLAGLLRGMLERIRTELAA